MQERLVVCIFSILQNVLNFLAVTTSPAANKTSFTGYALSSLLFSGSIHTFLTVFGKVLNRIICG